MKNLTKGYLEYLKNKNYSERTQYQYSTLLNVFIKKSKIEIPEDINLNRIQAFQSFLEKKGLSTAAQFSYLLAIRGLITYLKKSHQLVGIMPEEVELPKMAKKEITLPSPAQIQAFLEDIKGEPWLYVAVYTLLSTGLRISELCQLNKDDLKEEITIQGKGGKLRIIFLSGNCREILENYLSGRADTSQALIVDNSGTRIYPRLVQRYMKNYGEKLGFRMHPHILRHYYSTNLLRNGADLYSVQKLLGHSSITTTEKYLHITNNQLKDIYLKYNLL